MTLSQIIAKDSYFDVKIPDEGKWKVYLVIQDGHIKLQDITEQRKDVTEQGKEKTWLLEEKIEWDKEGKVISRTKQK